VKWVKTLFWMALFFFVVHFSMQNRDDVTLRYSIQNYQWFEVSKVPLFLVILCSVLFGVLMGGIGDLYNRFHLKRTLRQNKKEIERLEREIQSLRGPRSEQPSFLKRDN
jgi:uncharacterized integral membrane protein